MRKVPGNICFHFQKYLRPGGKVLISDYCCSEGPHSDEFNAYVKQRGYNLITIDSYCGVGVHNNMYLSFTNL